MKIVPHKNVFTGEPYELCPEFKVAERHQNSKEVESRCLWCKNAEYHHGFETIEQTGGCICLAGQDVRKLGEYPVTLRKEEEGERI